MKPGIIAFIIAVLSLAGLVWQASEARRLSKENAELRAQLSAAAEQAAAAAPAAAAPGGSRSESEVRELARLRGELAQLRTAATESARLRAENERLRGESAKARTDPAPAAASPAPAALTGETITRDSWTHAGYATPEAALVTAIWAMKEGNPRTYLESLAPEEHARISKAWENKSEAEIAAKHQADVANITSIRMIDRQEVSADQMTLGVYIDGVGRFEKVSMQRVGNDWKFKGFIRDPQAK